MPAWPAEFACPPPVRRAACWSIAAGLQTLLLPVRETGGLYVVTLATMLFRPPGPHFASIDRVAFLLLLGAVGMAVVAERRPLLLSRAVVLPMSALLLLNLAGLLLAPFDIQDWSIFASKWAIPLALFCMAGHVFCDPRSQRLLETFMLVVLAYLCFIAIAFLLDAHALIYPRFILDPNLGIHADRARGPFLQAVANGVTINMLGLLALGAVARGRLRGLWSALLFAGLPLAIVATKTRAVWISFAASIVLARLVCRQESVRRICALIMIGGVILTLGAFLILDSGSSLETRLFAASPVDYRVSVYQAAWQMFLEKPLLGWGTQPVQAELARRISGFKVDAFFFHNTYLEIAVERGLLGLALYAWIIIDLFRLARRPAPNRASPGHAFLGVEFRRLWSVIVFVYLVNASFVVMNHQFVNGLLFTLAGVLAWENRQELSSGAVR